MKVSELIDALAEAVANGEDFEVYGRLLQGGEAEFAIEDVCIDLTQQRVFLE